MVKTLRENVLVTDEDGDERAFTRLAVRDAMNRLETFRTTGTASGVFRGADGETRIRMGDDKGMEHVVRESALLNAWGKLLP
jgi:hypothetical protein